MKPNIKLFRDALSSRIQYHDSMLRIEKLGIDQAILKQSQAGLTLAQGNLAPAPMQNTAFPHRMLTTRQKLIGADGGIHNPPGAAGKTPALPGQPGHAATNVIDRLGGLDPQGMTIDGNNAAGLRKSAPIG